MRRILLSFIMVLLFATSSWSWTLVYGHDAQGNTTYGSLQVLIDAVRQGKQVRVMVDNPLSPPQFIFDAQTLWVNDQGVYAQNTSNVGTRIESDGGARFDAPYYFSYINMSTKGIVTVSQWSIGQHVQVGANETRYPMKWFVN